MAKKDKPVEQWTSRDFFREGERMAGKNASADEKLCAAMMVASLVEGANRERIAARLAVGVKDFEWMFDNLLHNRVFRSDGKVYANWFDEENGGMEFVLDMAVAAGLIDKTKRRREPKSKKIGAK